ncbi:hypothetical protein GGF46_005456 [Coemansia sp. RSA 552]|nr:hypothetical protein GGF46_005456 [Coemansia sp. RSA 552]
MRRVLRAGAALALLSTVTTGEQVWHDVNRYDAHGNECTLREKSGIVCSRVCVARLSDCPPALVPSCPTGQAWCSNGECRDECSDALENPCHCSRSGDKLPSEARDLWPCASQPNVTITQFHPWKSELDIRSACGTEAEAEDQSRTVGVWGDTWLGGDITAIWAECPDPPTPNFKYTESYWIATYAVNGTLFLMIALWSSYKGWAERGIRATVRGGKGQQSKQDDSEKLSVGEETAEKVTGAAATATAGDSNAGADPFAPGVSLYGYNGHILGTACVYSIGVVTVLWICFLGVWTADYYAVLPGKRNGVSYSLAYESDYLELATFLVLWSITFAILIALYVLKPHLRNYFRVQVLPARGQFVCVARPLHVVQLLEAHTNRLQLCVNAFAERLKVALSRDKEYTTCPVETTSEGRIYFNYQCTRYIYDGQSRQFAPYEFDLGTSHRGLIAQASGLSSSEASYRVELVGPNFVAVDVPSVFAAYAHEFTSFFYIYQLIFLWAFYFYAYYQVGLVDTGVIIISATIKVTLRLQSARRLKRMAEQEDSVLVRRDGDWQQISSRALVPGDVIEVRAGTQLSADCILISGNAIMDESSLTGEPLPIRKFPLHLDDGQYDVSGAGKISTLFAGTIVSQVQAVAKSADSLESDRVQALVRYTGTMSDKGQLVRKILFPNPISFIFDEQIKIVFAIFVVYALFVLAMAAYMYQGNTMAVLYFYLFTLAQLANPILPASLVIGQSVAAARLRRKQIYCVDPQRIMTAGKVQVFCFDKTGTLTKEGLEVYGVQGSQGAVFDKLTHDLVASGGLLQMGVASCHAVAELDQQMIGNPVDVEQFRASGATIGQDAEYLDVIHAAPESGLGTLDIVRRFEFVHARASMSVVVQDEQTGKLHVFVKGSFKRIKAISNAASVPSDYDAACSGLAREGCYVLSMAHKVLDVSLDELRKLSQEEIEADCDFLGLLMFKNMLKPDTKKAIGELKYGATRTVMITGDTALTGIYIARQCGMVPEGSRVLLGDIDGKTGDLVWTDVDANSPVEDIEAEMGELGTDGFPTTELAVSGAAFERLCATGRMGALVLRIRVFARMKPTHKVECVEQHMQYAATAMCGDGGNDCGALRAAHVGIALSDAEASIVSPFSSADRSVMSCVELLLESRAGLATSFANFAALICYGQIMAGMLKMASFYFGISLTENLWMLIDGAIATGLMLTISMSGPAKRLAPHRPTARILGPQMLTSVGGVVLMNWFFSAMAYVWLFQQDWFRCNEHSGAEADATKWWLLGDNYESSIISFVSTFQFINNGFIVNYGYHFRAGWYRNYPLLVVWGFLMAFVSYMLLADPNQVGCTFRLNCGTASVLEDAGYGKPTWSIEDYNNPLGHNVIPRAGRYKLWGYCLGNMAATNLWQVVVVNGPVRRWVRRRWPQRRLKVKL